MDKNMERRVWQRVYRNEAIPHRLTPYQRQNLRQSLQRLNANLRFFEGQVNDPVYGDAYRHLATQTEEHRKMVRRILGD